MKIRNHIEYGLVAGLLSLCRIIPEGCVFGIFHGLGLLSYACLGRRRSLALRNMAIAFPEMSPVERKRLVRKNFSIMAESLALNTLVMSGRISNERLIGMVEAPDWDRLEDARGTAPKGLLIYSAHIGNWELMSFYTALHLNRTIHVIARQANNPLLEQRILLPLRERLGIKVFYKKNALMHIMQAARKGELSGLMVDQKLNMVQGIPIEFFGKTAGTTASPALMQIRFGIQTMPVFMIRTGKRRYRMEIGEPTPWEDNGKPMEEQVKELTRLHQQSVENMIREYPAQWFWVHDRWNLKKEGR